jgi:hypothetical protein
MHFRCTPRYCTMQYVLYQWNISSFAQLFGRSLYASNSGPWNNFMGYLKSLSLFEGVRAQLHVMCPGTCNTLCIFFACHEPLSFSNTLIISTQYSMILPDPGVQLYLPIYLPTRPYTWAYTFTLLLPLQLQICFVYRFHQSSLSDASRYAQFTIQNWEHLWHQVSNLIYLWNRGKQ